MASSTVRSEDTIEYWIYVSSSEITLNDLLSSSLAFSHDYLWNNECFRLVERDTPCRHFYGSTNYGDNSDDEWFILHLLMQLTIKYADIVVKCVDFYGDFILDEAADFLPRWVTPTKVTNRIFLHNGALHIIPRQKDAPNYSLPEIISSPQEGVEIVRRSPHFTVADTSLQLCIERKIGSVIDNIKTNLHYAYCYLPAKLAFVLKNRPNYVSSAVQAFYSRDPADLKASRECKYFPHDDLVLRRVKFTRHLFAMISLQNFAPDRKSNWKVPSPNDPSYRWHVLGSKLTAGFEMLCARSCIFDSDSPSFGENDANWLKFIESLDKNGYFQGQRKSSSKYNELLLSAKGFYLDQIANPSKEQNNGAQIIEMLKCNNSFNVECLKKESESLLPEDDESWLKVTPEMLDDIFSKKSTSSNGICNDVKSKSNDSNSNKESIKEKLTSFVQSEGSLNGAKLPKKVPNEVIHLDGPSFESSMRHMLDLHIPESSSDSSDMDDSYGEESNDDNCIDEDVLSEMQNSLAEMKTYMKQMDEELVDSAIGKSFPMKKQTRAAPKVETILKNKSPGANSIDLEDDDFTPVDIDRTVVKNMLQSYWSEAGNPGPASTLLHSLNVLPSKIQKATLDSDDDDDDE